MSEVDEQQMFLCFKHLCQHSQSHGIVDKSDLIVLSCTAEGFFSETFAVLNIFASVPHVFLHLMAQYFFSFFFFTVEAALYNINSESKSKYMYKK